MAKHTKNGGQRLGVLQRIVRGLVALIVIAVGFGIYTGLWKTRPSPVTRSVSDDALVVRVMRAEPVEVVRWWEGYGTARPVFDADVSAEVAGVIAERDHTLDAGSWVEAGTPLVVIDAREYEERLARSLALIDSFAAQLTALDIDQESVDEQISLARESLGLIQWEIDQLVSAQSGGGASRAEIERLRIQLKSQQSVVRELQTQREQIPPRRAQVQAQLSSEEASARVARLDIDRCSVRAPIAGIVQDVFVDAGERVTVGAPIARVVDIRKMEVVVRLPISAASELRVGDPAQLDAEGEGERVWEGQTSRIAPEADSTTRTIAVYVEVDQAVSRDRAPDLIPGRFVMARVRSARSDRALVVPRRALLGERVMVIAGDGRIESREISVAYSVEARYEALDPDESQWAVISSGLDTGDRIVMSNFDELSPGMKVRSRDSGTGEAIGSAPDADRGESS